MTINLSKEEKQTVQNLLYAAMNDFEVEFKHDSKSVMNDLFCRLVLLDEEE